MSEKIYATQDFGDGSIQDDAQIQAFDSMDEARKWLLEPYLDGGWSLDSAVIEPADFSDCWLKLSNEPSEAIIEPLSMDEVTILKPGQNPGGPYYWVTPAPNVYAVVEIEPE